MQNYPNRKQKNNRIWLIIVAVIFILFSAFLVWNYFIRSDKPKPQTKDSDSQQTIQPNTEAQNTVTEPEQNTPNTDDGKTPHQNEGEDPNLSQSFTGFVTNKNVNTADKQLTIRVTIDQLVQPAGTCTLKLTAPDSNKTLIKTAPTIDNPSYSSCQGFDIPLSELSSGKWQINIEVKNSIKSGNIADGEVNIP